MKLVYTASKIFFFILVGVMILGFVSQAFAASTSNFVQQIKTAGDAIVLSLGSTMVVVAGVQYVVAGSQETVKQAQNTLYYAFAGIVFWYLGCLFIPGCTEVSVLSDILEVLRP